MCQAAKGHLKFKVKVSYDIMQLNMLCFMLYRTQMLRDNNSFLCNINESADVPNFYCRIIYFHGQGMSLFS